MKWIFTLIENVRRRLNFGFEAFKDFLFFLISNSTRHLMWHFASEELHEHRIMIPLFIKCSFMLATYKHVISRVRECVYERLHREWGRFVTFTEDDYIILDKQELVNIWRNLYIGITIEVASLECQLKMTWVILSLFIHMLQKESRLIKDTC